jgi:hypothetical protein
METFMEKVKRETKGKYISQLRERLPSLQGSENRFIHLDKIPRIYPVAEFRRTKVGSWKFKQYNGIVLVEVNHLSGLAEAELVKSKAALLPQTLAALVGSSGRSVKIWVRFSLPDGSLPDTEEQASLFHAQAYRVAVQCYQPLIPFPVTLKEPSLRQSFRKPYGTSIIEMRRYASFIATSNHKDLLSDLSGNRRFICVEVTAPIDTNVSVNYSQLYAQAFHAVMHGERYWLDDTEEALLKESNEEFRQVSPLEHLLQSCFSAASPEAGDGEWLMTMEVFNLLQANTREKLPIGKLNHLGRLLKKWNVPNKRTEKGSLYYLKKV